MNVEPVTWSVRTLTLLITLVASDCLVVGEEGAEPADNRVHASQSRDSAKTLSWSDLAPENGKPFIDPFAKLTDEQISDLSYVVQIRRLIAEEKISADGEDAADAAELAGRLEKQGVDIGWLMVQRERVRQLRSDQVDRASKSIANSLRNERVSLKGFAIPIHCEEERLKEFFFVPTCAACSHENAPPRLQVVFVATQHGIDNPGRRTPILLSGTIAAEATSRTIVNASGRVRVHAAYTMSSPTIEIPSHPNQPSDR